MIKREGVLDIEKKYEANFEHWSINVYIIVGIVQTINRNNYMILHVGLIIMLDHIEVTS
jgi:hypothetical protein